MNAPDLRPTATTDSAATMETGPDHQLEHLFAQKRGQIAEAFALSPALLKEDGEEPLAKVLPAGGPLLGQGKCWSCGYGPEDARHDPFRTCRICGYHPTL